jgi:REP element-mobilizing transposase RayT
MARPLRIEYPGAVYHITARGNARADIYRDDADREIFLRVLANVVAHHRWRVYAYCLMGNHYHLLLETPEPNLSRGMRQLNGTYTQRFNRRHERVGHLLQGRFHAVIVDRERYLLELSRYIALNPIRAGFVPEPAEWRWSSYRATSGTEATPPWLTVDPILEHFAADARTARERYRRFVDDGRNFPSPWPDLRGQILLGTESFVRQLEPRLAAAKISREIPRPQRLAARPALDALFGDPQSRDRSRRNRTIREAYARHGYTLCEIARHLQLHYSTVSRIAQVEMPQFKT